MLNVITCFEAGIERKTIALYRSIARFLRYPEEIRVFGVCPRVSHAPSEAAIKEAEALGVTYYDEPLNTAYPDYPLANKPYVCDFIAKRYPDGNYLFLDSDTMFINITRIGQIKRHKVAMRLVDGKNVRTASFDDEEGEYWAYLYKTLGVDTPKLVTSAYGDRFFEYYNSGFIYTTDANVFETWLRTMETVLDAEVMPKQGLFFVEQSILSAVVTSMKIDVHLLPADWNYPIERHNKLPPQVKIEPADEISHIHYHKIFEKGRSERKVLERAGFEKKRRLIRRFMDWPPSEDGPSKP